MNANFLFCILTLLIACTTTPRQADTRINLEADLLLAHFDCKTDVDDLHTVAAMSVLLKAPEFQELNVYAVAGAYGMQEGLYVPANELFEAVFNDRWSDAHADFDQALDEVAELALSTLDDGGNLWIAEAGQSDFSAALVERIRAERPDLNTLKRITIVQHSGWNEETTTLSSFDYVRANAGYIKIPDGNTDGNGSPGFRSVDPIDLTQALSDPELLSHWQLARSLADRYNGQEGRYLNEAIANGGLDFSDLSETCYILGLEDITDAQDFFNRFGGL